MSKPFLIVLIAALTTYAICSTAINYRLRAVNDRVVESCTPVTVTQRGAEA